MPSMCDCATSILHLQKCNGSRMNKYDDDYAFTAHAQHISLQFRIIRLLGFDGICCCCFCSLFSHTNTDHLIVQFTICCIQPKFQAH